MRTLPWSSSTFFSPYPSQSALYKPKLFESVMNRFAELLCLAWYVLSLQHMYGTPPLQLADFLLLMLQQLSESIGILVHVIQTSTQWYPGQDRVVGDLFTWLPPVNHLLMTPPSWQVYLISSTIAFGIQTLALTDAKFPVWYPYYGTWFIGVTVEPILAILPNIYESPKSPFDYITIAIQAARISTFIALIALYFTLRNDDKEYDNADAERQSLLRKKLAPKPSSSEASTEGYGATTDTTANDSDSEDEDTAKDSWLAKQKKAQELIQKRLKQDGNWFTYAKGFTVGSS